MLLFTLALVFPAMAVGAGVSLSPPSGTTLATLTLGQSMSVTLTAIGGAAPYAYWQGDVNDPNYDGNATYIPAGLSLDNNTGVLSGTPTTPGTYTFQISVVENFGDSGVATYTVVVNGGATPTLTQVTPPTGSTAGGTTVTLTGTNLTGTTAVSFGGTAASSFTVNNATTITATTPAHAAGAVNVVATTSNGMATLTNGYTYALPAPTAGAVSTTVAANSSANPITLSLGGGAATSVAVASAASHGTATASGTSITYTPTAGYSGPDSFTYTATNASGTSSPATVTVTVSAPTLVLSPASGALAGGSTGSAYNATISTSGGTAPYSYAITAGSLPIGLSLNTSSGALSGTPGSSGTSNFTVTATDANSATGSNAYSITISGLPPTASAVSATVAANSSANPITLSLGGGAATSVAVASAASHGTATASGTSITYTPTAGYSGADSFTYTATNASGTSSPATVSITVSAPTLNLTPASLGNGTVGVAYSATVSTTGGTAPYSYAITAGTLPAGLSLNTSTGVISGTPSTGGTSNLTITVTDSHSATGSRAYTLTIGAQAPTASAVSATVAANSSANPITLSLGGGAATSVAVASAASHGTATASGTSITYTPTAGYSGTDSFTYTATNASGTSTPATVSITVSAPTLNLTPASLGNGTVGVAYSATVSTTGGTAPYSYAITAGTLPAGLSLNTSTGVISGTPSTNGTSNLTITVTDSHSATGSRAYTLTIGAQAPTASAVSATVAANSSANPITLSLGGGAATSVAVASAASHGTATASGTSITYTPTAGYSGADSFTYTATNASGTSSPATVSITVSAPTLNLTPASLGNGTVGVAYSVTVSTTGGTAPYSYAITAGTLPAGLSLNTSTGVISGTPSTNGASNLTITVTDSHSATGSRAYTLTIGAQAPTASAVSATVAANSSANPITLSLGGGAATSVAVASAASHGTATASGTSITYTPTAGYSGADSFTYTATNASGTSSPATVSITVSAPTLNLTPASLGNGTVGVAYSATVSTTGGTAPYSYAITAGTLPAGLSLNTSTGVISGTPSTGGTSTLTITATDSVSATGSRAYTLVIGAQIPIASAVSATVAANSSANPITLSLGGGAATSVAVASAASHGTATASGTSITYTPTAGYSGADSFTYTATNASGTSSPATVSITVTAQPASVVSSARTLRVGEAVTVDLTDGATGGPFTSARVISLTPASAGQAIIVTEQPASAPVQRMMLSAAAPAPRYTLRFIPAAAFSGSAIATFALSNGTSTASGTVTFTVQARPDPSKNAEVIGLVNAQNRSAERFASTQMANFNRRLEQLHQNTCHGNAFGIKLGAGGATIPVADLATAAANALSGKTPNGDVANGSKRPTKVATTTAPAGDSRPAVAAPAAPSAAAGDCSSEPLAFWTDGFVNFGSNDTRHGRGTDFTTVGLSGGLDYRVSSALTLGVGLGYGNDRSLIGSDDTRSDADAISAAVYASFHPMPQVFIDGVLGYSWISFDSRRYVTADPSSGYARGSRDASQVFGSLTGSYEHRQGNLLLAPYGRLNAAITRFDAFSESGGGMYALHYGDQTQRYVTSFLGLRSSYDLPTSWGMVTPTLRIEWGHNFSNSGGVDLSYADLVGGPVYRLNTDPLSSNFVNVDLGADISLSKLWLLGIGYKTSLGASGEQNQLFRIGLTSRF